MTYLWIKWLHVLSSTLLFGTGVGSAFYLFAASLGRDPRVVAAVSRYVVLADWLFTATTVVIQPASGFWMLQQVQLPWRIGWVRWSILLYLLAVGCWLPVLGLQIRMRNLAGASARRGEPLPTAYWRAFRYWVALGFPALFAFLAVFYLMVVKPPLP